MAGRGCNPSCLVPIAIGIVSPERSRRMYQDKRKIKKQERLFKYNSLIIDVTFLLAQILRLRSGQKTHSVSFFSLTRPASPSYFIFFDAYSDSMYFRRAAVLVNSCVLLDAERNVTLISFSKRLISANQ